MFVEESHMPAVLGDPTEKSLVESDQANVEAILRNRHTQLFGSRIPWQDTASLELSCEQALPHVEIIDSSDKALKSSPKNSALSSAAVVNTVQPVKLQS